MYDAGSHSISDLAERFSVSGPTVYRTSLVSPKGYKRFIESIGLKSVGCSIAPQTRGRHAPGGRAGARTN